MRKALVTTIERTINTWHHGVNGEPGYWQDVVYAPNSIINFIIYDEQNGYVPPENTEIVDVDTLPANAKIGDSII